MCPILPPVVQNQSVLFHFWVLLLSTALIASSLSFFIDGGPAACFFFFLFNKDLKDMILCFFWVVFFSVFVFLFFPPRAVAKKMGCQPCAKAGVVTGGIGVFFPEDLMASLFWQDWMHGSS